MNRKIVKDGSQIPLVISTYFGLMASTVLVLFGIPCMYMILGDLEIIEKMDKE